MLETRGEIAAVVFHVRCHCMRCGREMGADLDFSRPIAPRPVRKELAGELPVNVAYPVASDVNIGRIPVQ
jgi:hypothetical protein